MTRYILHIYLGYADECIAFDQSGSSVPAASHTSIAANAPIPSGATITTSSKNLTTPKKTTTPIWPTAEEEKVRLYDQAQAIAKRTQAYGTYSPSLHSRTSSENAPPRVVTPPRQGGSGGTGMMSPSVSISAGAALYQSAVSSMSARPSSAGMHASSSFGGAPPQSSSGAPAPSSPPASVPQYPQAQSSPSSSGTGARNVPQYPSAADEKAALKLYHEAKRAVDRNQNIHVQDVQHDDASPAPIAYDALYPSPPAGGSSGGAETGPHPDEGLPPPFETSGSERPLHNDAHMSEKEKLRRQYEAQDTAAVSAPPPPHFYSEQGDSPQVFSPAYASGGGLPSYADPPAESGLSEKETLRKRYEQDHATAAFTAALARQQSPPPFIAQPRAQPAYQSQPPSPPHPRINGTRTQPVPPNINGVRPLTAAEEKAQLKAKYEAEERDARGTSGGSSGSSNGASMKGFMSNTYDDIYSSPASRHPYANGGASPPSPPPPPPPLLPRPPVEYIQQTQEEDIRARHYYVGVEEALQGLPAMRSTTPGVAGGSTLRNPHLEVRPFSPFDAGLGYGYGGASGTRSPPPRS